MIQNIPDTVMIAVATAIFVGGSVWGLAWWLSGQFSIIKNLVHEQIDKTEAAILSKLEYHEKHDDSRFDDLKRDIWEVRLRAAANTSKINEELDKLKT